MREDVFRRPAGEIEKRARRQKFEAGGGNGAAPLALQHGIELGAQGMQVKNVRGSIAQLLVAEFGGAPVGGLLLFGEIDAEQIATQILEPVPIGEGADQL